MHPKVRKEKSAPKQSQSIPAHPNPYALLIIKPPVTVAKDEPIRPPDLTTEVNETRLTPYKRIQQKREQRNAKKMQRKEENRFLDGAITVAKDERTQTAQAEDNLCPFIEAVNKKDVLQPQ